MKQCIAVVLSIVLAAPPVFADQKQPKPIDWRKLKTGVKIALTAAGGQPGTERVLLVSDSVLITRGAAPPKLPRPVEEFLFAVGARWPAIFNEGLIATSDRERLRVSQDGVFEGGRKLADLTDVVRYTPRGDALSISEAPHSHVGRNALIVAALVIIVPIISWSIACSGRYGCT